MNNNRSFVATVFFRTAGMLGLCAAPGIGGLVTIGAYFVLASIGTIKVSNTAEPLSPLLVGAMAGGLYVLFAAWILIQDLFPSRDQWLTDWLYGGWRIPLLAMLARHPRPWATFIPVLALHVLVCCAASVGCATLALAGNMFMPGLSGFLGGAIVGQIAGITIMDRGFGAYLRHKFGDT